MIRTRQCTNELARALADALGDAAVVVTSVEEATGHVLAGATTVVLAPPKITSDTGVAYALEWQVPIVGAPVADPDAAWDALDRALSAIDPFVEWERADPITWTGAQTAAAPAYLLTITRTVPKGDPQ
jgi:hypothetical protein|nr:MAG TPA: hypothetical protein [Caudoviricetes sp.]